MSVMSDNTPDIVILADPGRWIVVPNSWPFGGHDTPRDWALAVADERTGMRPETRFLTDWLGDALTTIAEAVDDNELHAVYLPDPAGDHAIVRVQYGLADGPREVALRRLVGADDPDAVEPPLVEAVHTDRLGDGLRALRFHARGERRALTGFMTYAFRSDPYDFRIVCADANLGRLTELGPEIEEFVASVGLEQRSR